MGENYLNRLAFCVALFIVLTMVIPAPSSVFPSLIQPSTQSSESSPLQSFLSQNHGISTVTPSSSLAASIPSAFAQPLIQSNSPSSQDSQYIQNSLQSLIQKNQVTQVPDKQPAAILSSSITNSKVNDQNSLASAPKLDSSLLSQTSLPFIQNSGQVDNRVKFYADTFAGTVFVTDKGLRYSFVQQDSKQYNQITKQQGVAVDEQFVGTSGLLSPQGIDRSNSQVNYIVGNKADWKSNVPTYNAVDLGQIWSGVDVTLKAHGENIEKIFTVQPGGSVDNIRVSLNGINSLSVGSDGSLLIGTQLGTISMTNPHAYQEINGVQIPVKVAYSISGNDYGFAVGPYDNNYPLVIDPLLASTYFGGGTADQVRAISVDSSGNVYVAGSTSSTNFPTTTGAFQTSLTGSTDAFVSKLNPGLTTVLASTYIGGSGYSSAYGITPDSSGDVYIVGVADTSNFPTTSGVVQQGYPGGGVGDGFVSELNLGNTGSSQLVASTYLGGGGANGATAYAVTRDSSGNVWVAGWDDTSNFPTTSGAFQTTDNDVGSTVGNYFVAELNSNLHTITAATYLGGSGSGFGDGGQIALALDPSGNVYVAGDAENTNFPTTNGTFQRSFPGGSSAVTVSKLNNALTQLVASTYLGGSTGAGIGYGPTITVDSSGNVYVAGSTSSTNFPTTTGAYQRTYSSGSTDNFVTELNNGLTAPVASTYLGSGAVQAMALGPGGSVLVTGWTTSSSFPTTPGAYQTTLAGTQNAFVSKLNPGFTSLLASTYIGGSGSDNPFVMALDPSGNNVYISGYTSSTNYPTTAGAIKTTSSSSQTGFVSELNLAVTYDVSNQATCQAISGATWTGSNTCNSPSTLTLNSGDSLTIESGINFVSTGTITSSGTITILSGGTLSYNQMTNNAGDTITNSGTISSSASSSFDNYGIINNNAGGILQSSGGSTEYNHAGATINNSGTMTDTACSSGSINGGPCQGDSVTPYNAGTINNLSGGKIYNYFHFVNSSPSNLSGTINNNAGATITNYDIFYQNGIVNNAGTFDNNHGGDITAFCNANFDNTGTLLGRVQDTASSCTSPTTVTTSLSASTIALGAGTVSDQATLSGGSSPTGTITFEIYSDNTCTVSVQQLSTPVTVSGNGVYNSVAFTPPSAGTYYFQAFYGGDGTNQISSSSCTSETLTVTSPLPPSVPQVSITSPTSGATISTSSITVTGSASSTSSTVQSVQVSVDGGAYSAATNTGTNFSTWSFAASGLANGQHELLARTTDSAGNVGTSYGTDVVTSTIPIAPPGVPLLGMAFDPANHDMYVTHIGSSTSPTISVVDPANTIVATIPVGPVGSPLFGIAFDPLNNALYVNGPGFVYVIDGDPSHGSTYNTIVRAISGPSGGFTPGGSDIVFNPANSEIYVDGGPIQVIDGNPTHGATYNTIVTTVPTNAGSMAFDPLNGDVYVYANTGTNTGTVFEINHSTNTVGAPIVGAAGNGGIAFVPTNDRLYVASNPTSGTSVLIEIDGNPADGSTYNTVVGGIPYSSSAHPIALAFDPANSHLYAVDDLGTTTPGFSVVDVNPSDGTTYNTVVNTVTTGTIPTQDIAFDPANSDVYVTDQASNIYVTSAPTLFTISVQPPTLTITTPANNAVLGTTTPTVSGTASDLNSVTSVSWSVDGGTVSAASTSDNFAHWTFTPTLAQGPHVISVTATNSLGLTTSRSITITVNTSTPTESISSPSNNAALSTTTPTISGTSSDSIAVESVSWSADGGPSNAIAGITPSQTVSWSFTPITPLAAGTHSIMVNSTNSAGLVSTQSFSIVVTTTPPTLSITSPANGATLYTQTPTVSGTASDIVSFAVSWKVDSGPVSSATGTNAWIFTTGTLASGPHTIYVTATDSAGLSTTQSITVTVAPLTLTIDSPANNTVTPQNVITVSSHVVSSATVTSVGVDIDHTGTFAPATLDTLSGDWKFTTGTLSNGVHSITVQATDGTNTVTANNIITVTSTPPTIGLPAGGVAAVQTTSSTPAATVNSPVFTIDQESLIMSVADQNAANQGLKSVTGFVATTSQPQGLLVTLNQNPTTTSQYSSNQWLVSSSPYSDYQTKLGSRVGDSVYAWYNPSSNYWYLQNGASFGWGQAGDVPVVGDWTGSGKTSVGVFRPSAGYWYLQNGASFGWGQAGDIPVVGDWTGSGKTSVGVFRPSAGYWYLQNGASFGWGQAGDIPVVGNWDGVKSSSGVPITEVGVFRPSAGYWYLRNNDGSLTGVGWGQAGDVPVVGDWTGSGKTSVGVFRPSAGYWYLQNGASFGWGQAGDIPVVGNWDGVKSSSGVPITEVGVFRPSAGYWYLRNNDGSLTGVGWGQAGDVPVVGDWTGSGKQSPGVLRPVTSGTSATPTASVIAASNVNSIAGTSVEGIQRNGCQSNAAGDAICDEWKVSPGLKVPYTDSAGNTAYYQYYCQGDGYQVTDSTQPLGSLANPDPICPNVNKQDVFVEVDYMAGFQPSTTAMSDVITAFANHGIQLHIQINPDESGFHNQTIPLNGYTTSSGTYIDGFFDYKQKYFGLASEQTATPPTGFSGTQSQYTTDLLSAKRQAFHYAMFIDELRDTPTSSGWADIGGPNLIVSLGAFTNDVGSVAEQEGTFMHELGHNFGLNHGGATSDSLNCKPNYESVMNYLFQFPDFVTGRPLDYSESQVTSLDETNLNENTGIGQSTPSGLQTVIGGVDLSGNNYQLPLGATFGSSVLFSRDSSPQTSVQKNIHEFNIPNCDSSTNSQLTTLTGWNDWANLNFNFRGSALFDNGYYTPPFLNKDISPGTLAAIQVAVVSKLDSAFDSLPNSDFVNPTTSTVTFNNDLTTVISDIQNKNISGAISELQTILSLVNGPSPLITNTSAQQTIVPMLNGLISSLQTHLPPTASSQTVYVNGITPTPVTLQATDPNNLPLSYTYTNPSEGALTGTAPNLVFNAFSSFTNIDSFTLQATNANNLQSNTATILLKLENFPIANSQSVTVTENSNIATTLTGSGGSAPLQFSIVQGPSSGSLSGTIPNLVYTPNAGFTGQDTFTFTTTDGIVTSSPATLTINVVAPSQTTVSTMTTVTPMPSSITVGGSTTVTAQVSGPGPSPTGTITFSAPSGSFQNQNPASCTLNSAGSCSLTFTPSSAGQVQISASYSGDSNNLPSSGSNTLTVSKATTSTAVSFTPSNSAVVGTTTTVIAQINNGFLPGQTVSFVSDSSGKFNSTTCTVVNNQCGVTYTPSSVGSGTHTITATYSGDPNNQGRSGSAALSVTPTTPTESISLQPSSVTVGGSSAVSVTINGVSPTGTVSFTSNSTQTFSSLSCTLTGGTCAVSYNALGSPGHVLITTTYSGDPNNQASTGSAILTVSKATTSTAVSFTPSNSAVVGTTTTVIAQINNGFLPGQTVSFVSDSSGKFNSTTCTVVNNQCGVTYTPSSVGSGTHTITATYSGDPNNQGSFGSNTLTVSKATTSTAVSFTSPSITVGGSTTVTAQVSGPGPLPTGTITFSAPSGSFQNQNPASCTLNSAGSCSLTFTPSSAGQVQISASYSGDSDNQGSSGNANLDVTPTTPAESISLQPLSVTVGGSSAVSVTINGVSPTGTVSFTSNNTGSFNTSSCNINNPCVVTYTPTTVGNGYHKITASYSGDSNNKPSVNSAVLSVSKATPATTILLGSPSINIGGSTTVTAQITNGFSLSGQTISFSAPSGSFQPTSCTLSNAGTCFVTFTSSTPGQVSILGSYLGDQNNQGSSGITILTVGSLQSEKAGIASSIQGLESGVFDKGIKQKLDRAAIHVQNSAGNNLWNIDGTTLNLKHGNMVFNEEANAVNLLLTLLPKTTSQDNDLADPQDTSTHDNDLNSITPSPLPSDTYSAIQVIINQLVSIDSTMAQNQITSANALFSSLQSHNAPSQLIQQVQQDINTANSWLQKAQSDATSGNFHRAIFEYRQAWSFATKALDLSGANLQGANLSGINLSGSSLKGANLQGANLSGANLQGDDLSGANLQGANLSGAILVGANLQGANLSNLTGADLQNTDLQNANLQGANLSGSNFTGANLQGANLKGANTQGTIGVH